MPGAIFDLKNCIFGMHIPCVVLHNIESSERGKKIHSLSVPFRAMFPGVCRGEGV